MCCTLHMGNSHPCEAFDFSSSSSVSASAPLLINSDNVDNIDVIGWSRAGGGSTPISPGAGRLPNYRAVIVQNQPNTGQAPECDCYFMQMQRWLSRDWQMHCCIAARVVLIVEVCQMGYCGLILWCGIVMWYWGIEVLQCGHYYCPIQSNSADPLTGNCTFVPFQLLPPTCILVTDTGIPVY